MNIKRFLSGALCAVLLLALCPAAAADAPCEISSAEELSLLRETPDGDFVLTADIDMTGVDWQPIAFSGTLDGGGHTIYNLTVTSLGADRAETVDGNDKTYDTALTGFFSVLSGASVRDLSLRGVNIAVETPENVFAGTLAGFASPETVLENVSVFDARIDLTSANPPMSTTAASPVSVGSSASAAERIRTAPRIPHSFSPMRALRRSAARSFSAAFSPAATRRSPAAPPRLTATPPAAAMRTTADSSVCSISTTRPWTSARSPAAP